MSDQRIHDALIRGGLSHSGACAVMGNMYCESLMKSNIVEKRCPMSDSDYTWNVDNGGMSLSQFAHDSYGYGLCQWTYYSRKTELYNLAKTKGVSVGDEEMQCELCINELRRDFSGLYQYLCGDCDLYTATSRVCCEYERPAVNNIGQRYNAAQQFYREFDGQPDPDPDQDDDPQPQPEPQPVPETCEITVRVLKRGNYGRDVFLLQSGLKDMGYSLGSYGADGDYGDCTEAAVRAFQADCNLDVTGIADGDVWQIVFQ